MSGLGGGIASTASRTAPVSFSSNRAVQHNITIVNLANADDIVRAGIPNNSDMIVNQVVGNYASNSSMRKIMKLRGVPS